MAEMSDELKALYEIEAMQQTIDRLEAENRGLRAERLTPAETEPHYKAIARALEGERDVHVFANIIERVEIDGKTALRQLVVATCNDSNPELVSKLFESTKGLCAQIGVDLKKEFEEQEMSQFEVDYRDLAVVSAIMLNTLVGLDSARELFAQTRAQEAILKANSVSDPLRALDALEDVTRQFEQHIDASPATAEEKASARKGALREAAE